MKLKDRVAALKEQKKVIKNRDTFYYRKGYRWFREAVKLIKQVKILKKEIHQL